MADEERQQSGKPLGGRVFMRPGDTDTHWGLTGARKTERPDINDDETYPVRGLRLKQLLDGELALRARLLWELDMEIEIQEGGGPLHG